MHSMTWCMMAEARILYKHGQRRGLGTCLEQMESPRPVPPRLRGRFISSSLPCTYSLNRLRRPRCAMPTPAATARDNETRTFYDAYIRRACCQQQSLFVLAHWRARMAEPHREGHQQV